MDALSGRHQTTRGIWLARATKARAAAGQRWGWPAGWRASCVLGAEGPFRWVQVAAPTTLVMDLEGSDGRERGEDDTSFERQVRRQQGAASSCNNWALHHAPPGCCSAAAGTGCTALLGRRFAAPAAPAQSLACRTSDPTRLPASSPRPARRQSALFALAVADIVLVNMWAKDIGRETGAGKPLLKTIFQVNLKLFQVGGGAQAGPRRAW